ncbi:MAG TPA: hypothetical protein VFA41_07970 [Ktedonobacteraceae bacterium]|jgi:DNA-directed RNA polymerase specialized sigma24 family protein|nr:hypothetical protein [Ktedonobacteraceae bacterium]
MTRRIPKEHEDAMIEAYLNGATQEEAAALFGYYKLTCANVLRRRGITKRSASDAGRISAQARRVPKDVEDAIVAAYLEGATAKEAAAQFGYSNVTCFNILSRRGIAHRNSGEARSVPREHADAIVEAYRNGATAEDAASLFGYSRSTCINILRQRGITVRTAAEALRHYTVDESFFDYIDSEDKAYWLGFLTADGFIQSKSVGIHLQIGDAEHLYKFRASLDAQYPIGFRDVTASNGTVCSQATIRIFSIKLVRALNQLGLSQNKTFTVRPCEYIPKAFLAAYWRGIFDGDGWISCTGLLKRKYSVGLCGNQAIVSGFSDFISQHVQSRASIKPTDRIFKREYNGRLLACAVLRVLYSGATVYLDRKYILACKLCGESL